MEKPEIDEEFESVFMDKNAEADLAEHRGDKHFTEEDEDEIEDSLQP